MPSFWVKRLQGLPPRPALPHCHRFHTLSPRSCFVVFVNINDFCLAFPHYCFLEQFVPIYGEKNGLIAGLPSLENVLQSACAAPSGRAPGSFRGVCVVTKLQGTSLHPLPRVRCRSPRMWQSPSLRIVQLNLVDELLPELPVLIYSPSSHA